MIEYADVVHIIDREIARYEASERDAVRAIAFDPTNLVEHQARHQAARSKKFALQALKFEIKGLDLMAQDTVQ
jgi:hypothetical protein